MRNSTKMWSLLVAILWSSLVGCNREERVLDPAPRRMPQVQVEQKPIELPPTELVYVEQAGAKFDNTLKPGMTMDEQRSVFEQDLKNQVADWKARALLAEKRLEDWKCEVPSPNFVDYRDSEIDECMKHEIVPLPGDLTTEDGVIAALHQAEIAWRMCLAPISAYRDFAAKNNAAEVANRFPKGTAYGLEKTWAKRMDVAKHYLKAAHSYIFHGPEDLMVFRPACSRSHSICGLQSRASLASEILYLSDIEHITLAEIAPGLTKDALEQKIKTGVKELMESWEVATDDETDSGKTAFAEHLCDDLSTELDAKQITLLGCDQGELVDEGGADGGEASDGTNDKEMKFAPENAD